MSGLTILHKGDKVQFTCHVDTTAAQARKLGVPVPTANLHFANEAIGAEMCVLYLETTGPQLIAGASGSRVDRRASRVSWANRLARGRNPGDAASRSRSLQQQLEQRRGRERRRGGRGRAEDGRDGSIGAIKELNAEAAVTNGVTCGSTTCIPPTGGMIPLGACCLPNDRCGASIGAVLAGVGDGGSSCIDTAAGSPDPSCPAQSIMGMSLLACCSAGGVCGVDLSVLGLGCNSLSVLGALVPGAEGPRSLVETPPEVRSPTRRQNRPSLAIRRVYRWRRRRCCRCRRQSDEGGELRSVVAASDEGPLLWGLGRASFTRASRRRVATPVPSSLAIASAIAEAPR